MPAQPTSTSPDHASDSLRFALHPPTVALTVPQTAHLRHQLDALGVACSAIMHVAEELQPCQCRNTLIAVSGSIYTSFLPLASLLNRNGQREQTTTLDTPPLDAASDAATAQGDQSGGTSANTPRTASGSASPGIGADPARGGYPEDQPNHEGANP